MTTKKSDRKGTAATRVTPEKRLAFCTELEKCGNVTAASLAAGVSRQHAYRLREGDEDFAAAWDEALEKAMDKLEAEAYRRAHDGVPEPVFHEGVVCGFKQRYSDTLLMFLLNGRRSEVFKHRAEVTGKDGAPVTGTVIVLPPKGGG